jgi:CHAT domain-containing protein
MTKPHKFLIINILCWILPQLLLAQSLQDSIQQRNALCDTLFTRKAYSKALPAFLDLQQLLRRHLPPTDTLFIITSYRLAQVVVFSEKYDTAIVILNELTRIIPQSVFKERFIYSDVYNFIGFCHRKLRQYSFAEQAYMQSYETVLPLQRQYPQKVGNRLHNLSVLYFDMGKIDAAIDFSQKSLAYTLKGSEDYLARMHILASAYKRKGRFREALQTIQLTLNQLDTLKENYAIQLMNIASFYADIELTDKALEGMQRAHRKLGTFSQQSSTYAHFNNNLSILYVKVKQDSLGLSHALTACRLAERLPNKVNYFLYMSQLADCYTQLGDTAKALPLALNSLDFMQKQGVQQAEPYYWTLVNAIRLYECKGDFQKAIDYNEQLLAIFNKVWSESDDKCIVSTLKLIELYQKQGAFKQSRTLLKQLAQTMNTQVIYNLDVLDEESKNIFINKSVKKYHHLLLSELENTQEKDNQLTHLAYQAELTIKGVVLGSTQLFRQMVRQSKDATVQKWDQQRVALNRAIEQAYSKQFDLKYIDSLKNNLNVVEANLMAAMPALNDLKRQTIDFDSIRASLPPQSCAIEFTHFKYFDTKSWKDSVLYGAILIKPEQMHPEWISLCHEKQLYDLLKSNENLETFYAARGAGTGRKRIPKKKTTPIKASELPADQLYQLIWKPLETHLSGVKTIYYAPSGLLHRIAYAALLTDENYFLCNKYDLQAVSSTRNLIFERAEKDNALIINQKQNLLIYGGIRYDGDSLALLAAAAEPKSSFWSLMHKRLGVKKRGNETEAWAYLEGTKWEAERITQLFKKKKRTVETKIGFAASETDFKNRQYQSVSPNLIHFATHGFSYQKPILTTNQSFEMASNPLIRSGLVMAGANQVWLGQKPFADFEDGILTAYEISLMNLSNTKLVVLSACETGLGDIEGSEGVFGLQRAFKMAGVPYTMMSLWSVPDEQTAELMIQFYTYLIDNQSITTAFSNAQRAMQKKYSPYYWAGFVLAR